MKKNDINTEKKSFPLKTVVIVAIAVILAIMVPKLLFGQENLLENPGFETGSLDPYWQTQEETGIIYADTVAFQGSYSLYSEIYTGGMQEWRLQAFQVLSQGVLTLYGNYNISLWCRGAEDYPEGIIVNLCGNNNPWPWMGAWDTLAVTTDWTYHSISFSVTDTSDIPRLSFNFGHNDRYAKIWIDSVALIETIHVDTIPPNPQEIENVILYPNPFRTSIYLARPENLMNFEPQIYNVRGQPVDLEIEDLLLNFVGQPPGVYLIQVGTQIKKIVKLE